MHGVVEMTNPTSDTIFAFKVLYFVTTGKMHQPLAVYGLAHQGHHQTLPEAHSHLQNQRPHILRLGPLTCLQAQVPDLDCSYHVLVGDS